MTELIDQFHFLRPGWLLLAPALVLLETLLPRRDAAADPQLARVIDADLLQHLQIKPRHNRWLGPGGALTLMTALILLTLAGPTWRQQPSPLAEDAAPLVLVLDVSRSMASDDVAPSRLERGRQKMIDLLDRNPDKRVAIVVYAGSAHTVLPLTNDHDIAQIYLNSIEVGMAPRPGKFPEYVLPGLTRILGGSQHRGAIVLVTDGLGEDSPSRINAWCQTSRHRWLVYGIGDETTTRSTPLDRDRLRNLAGNCGGQYFDDSIDTRDVDALSDALGDRYLVVDDEALPWLDSGYPLVFPALALALLWFRRGWTRHWGWLLLPLCLGVSDPGVAATEKTSDAAPVTEEVATSVLARAVDGFAGLWLTDDQYGRILLELGYYRRAASAFQSPGWQALAYYYAGDFERAAELFTRGDNASAQFNEANARAHRRDYLRALRRYDALLESQPDFPGARTNRQTIQAIVDEINQVSEAQKQEQGVSGEDIGEDDPQIADGADELVEESDIDRYSAEDILASPELAELWLQAVHQNPTAFLEAKFGAQLRERGVSEP